MQLTIQLIACSQAILVKAVSPLLCKRAESIEREMTGAYLSESVNSTDREGESLMSKIRERGQD